MVVSVSSFISATPDRLAPIFSPAASKLERSRAAVAALPSKARTKAKRQRSTAVSRRSPRSWWMRRLAVSIEKASSTRPSPTAIMASAPSVLASMRSLPVARARRRLSFVQCPGPFAVAEACIRRRQVAGRQQGRVLVAELPEASHALLVQLLRPCQIAFVADGGAEHERGIGRAPGISELTVEHESLLGPKPRRRWISRVDRHNGGSVEGFGADGRRTLVGLEGAFETTAAFRQVAPQIPEPPQCPCQPQGKLALPCRLEPVQGGSEVVVLLLQPVEPVPGAPAQVRLRLFRERQEVLYVAPSEFLCLARLLEPLGSVMPDRLQHREPRILVRPLQPHQARVDERRKPVDDVEVIPADALRRLEGASSREHGELQEQALLLRLEQVVAPVDRGAEGALALRCGPRAAFEHLQTVVEALP